MTWTVSTFAALHDAVWRFCFSCWFNSWSFLKCSGWWFYHECMIDYLRQSIYLVVFENCHNLTYVFCPNYKLSLGWQRKTSKSNCIWQEPIKFLFYIVHSQSKLCSIIFVDSTQVLTNSGCGLIKLSFHFLNTSGSSALAKKGRQILSCYFQGRVNLDQAFQWISWETR